MSAMQTAGPKIESTGDSLRIEFPAPAHQAVSFVVALSAPVLWLLAMKLFTGPKISDLWPSVFGPLLTCAWLIWPAARRYIILLSEKGLAIRQQAFGVHWTKFYPLAEIQNLHLRYNPVLGKPPKQWELVFDRYAMGHEIPIPMTLPDGQNVRGAIYSRFPQLAPEEQPTVISS